MLLEGMSPKERVLARPERRSSPKESVTKEVAKRRRREASLGVEGWWSVVRGRAEPFVTRERRMRVSPQWAVRRVEGVEGCQKGVGDGVEIRAMEQVEPPWKGLPLVFVLFVGLGGRRLWGEMSEVLMGRSAAMESESERRRRSWFWMKVRSAARKAWVRIVDMVGWGLLGENAEGRKRRK